MSAEQWFLSATERGNPATAIDRRPQRASTHSGRSWTDGNEVVAHIHGADYFAALRAAVDNLQAGDLLLFTDWRGDPDESLDGRPVATVFADAARRGAIVKGLFWRSHWDKISYSEEQNRSLADEIRAAGGEVLLDMRVRPLGSHHQKFIVLRHPGRPEHDVAYVGGIDLCHTRNDTAAHHGDPQAVRMGKVWGPRPPWHDAQVEIRGPAVGDVEFTFRERWTDPTPLELNPVGRADAYLHRDDEHPDPLPEQLPDPPPCGDTSVQILRTYPHKRPTFPFAPRGERSVARGYDKAVRRGHSLVYIEDQYFWSGEVVSCFAKALAADDNLRLIVVLSQYASQDGRVGIAADMIPRTQAVDDVMKAGPGRVGIYGIENEANNPIYVHAKVCVVDDVWMTIGSDNVNRRSWTYDSEWTAAMIDHTLDEREPRLLDKHGEHARVFPRNVRLQLAREHLGRAEGDDADLVDPISVFDAFQRTADALQAWHEGGRVGPRPPGRVRHFYPKYYRGPLKLAAQTVYKYAADPDGRPRNLRGTDTF